MAYFWTCPKCDWLGTFGDDEEPHCDREVTAEELPGFLREHNSPQAPGVKG